MKRGIAAFQGKYAPQFQNKSWYDEGTVANFDETWQVPKGRTYRVRVIGDVYDEDGNWVEIVDAVSGSVEY